MSRAAVGIGDDGLGVPVVEAGRVGADGVAERVGAQSAAGLEEPPPCTTSWLTRFWLSYWKALSA